MDGRRNQEHWITRTTTNTHGCCSEHRGFCITAAFRGREQAPSDSGALWGFPSVAGINSRHEPSTRPRSLSQFRRVPITAVSLLVTSWLSRRAARPRRQRQPPGSVDAVGLFRPCAIIRSRSWCLASLGSSRAACRNYRMGSRHSVASPRAALRLTHNAGSLRTIVSGEASLWHSGHAIC